MDSNKTRLRLLVGLAILITGCSLNDLVDVGPPPDGAVDPRVVESLTGALGLYNSALGAAALATSRYAFTFGLYTDELRAGPNLTSGGVQSMVIADARADSGSIDGDRLFSMRAKSEYARGALRRFPEAPVAKIGELYALQGMAEVMLAEGFCSGVPLTRVPYGENFQYTPGFTTTEVLRHAMTLLDTAALEGKDSLAIVTLAHVGRGRIYLNLGMYDSAAAAVALVPTTATYLTYATTGGAWNSAVGTERDVDRTHLINAEGGTGLSWVASSPAVQDPRVRVTTVIQNGVVQFTSPVRQAKYQQTSSATPQRLADGIEARLIEAENELQPAADPHGPWLQTLNALRATIGLPDTTDPGTENGRVDLLFRERAFWLYLTGHRQGDMRRLVRQYHRPVETVYPSGAYSLPTFYVVYQDLATSRLGVQEEQINSLYHGCFDRAP